MSRDDKCRVCGSKAHIADWQRGFGKFIDCEECGRYIVEISSETLFEEKWVRNTLYYYIRNIARRDVPVMLTGVDSDTNEFEIITNEDLNNIYPQSVHEKIDWMLINLSNHATQFGEQISLVSDIVRFSAMFLINNETSAVDDYLKPIIEMLGDMNYLKLLGDYQVFTISYEGWKRIDELQGTKINSKKAFVAMWFDDSMTEERDAIKNAIRETGFLPIIIDEKEHNNQIVPEILYEIDTCKFMIADLTGGRQGVYYEAGYGLGKDKEVILTLKNDSGDVPHFDVSQTNQIRYNSSEELKTRLIKRIEATIK